MKSNPSFLKKPNARLMIMLISAGIVLLIPLVLQVTIGTGIDGQGFNWKVNDFLNFGIFILITGILFKLVLKKFKRTLTRTLIFGTILLMLIVLGIDLAVGIFNIPGFSGN